MKPEPISLPARRMIKRVQEGSVDLWIGLKTLPEFDKKALISKDIVVNLILKSFYREGSPPIINKEDLKGKKVSIILGYSYGGWIKYIKDPTNKITFYETTSHLSALLMLQHNRADYTLDYDLPSKEVKNQLKIKNLTSNVISKLGCYFVVPKKSSLNKDLLVKLEKSFTAFKKANKVNSVEDIYNVFLAKYKL